MLRLVALGGLGEVGMNCLAIESGREILVVDCGVTFPDADYGVDVYHPRLDWLFDRASDVRGVVLTHGHEDHIGGLPYLLGELDVPVFGPPMALELVRRRLAEHGFEDGEIDLRKTRVRTPFEVGGFGVEPVRVSHSTVDATALAIRVGGQTLVHTGDFRMESDPEDPEGTDVERLEALGKEGVDLLLSDSTNVDRAKDGVTEGQVAGALAEQIASAKARVVIAMFASNVARLGAVLRAARDARRKVLPLGRSVGTHLEAAERTGWLTAGAGLLVSADEASRMPREELLIVATGTQAEARSALARLATDSHPWLRLEEGDRVILSSRVIPGNDRAVMTMVGELLRRGIEVISKLDDERIHASGHASRSEQEKMLALVGPRAFVPLHGTLHHLHRHAAVARGMGVEHVLVAENGDAVEWDRGLRKSERVPAGKIAAAFGEDIGEEVLRERAQLGRGGVVALAVVRDGAGRLAAPVRAVERGVLDEVDWDSLRDAERAAARAVRDLGDRADEDAVREAARLAARRAIENATGRRPMVVVLVAETNGRRER